MAKVLLNCLDVVGESMAGPAIRYWELAKALAATHEVTLFIPNQTTIKPENFQLISACNQSLNSILKNYDAMISQQFTQRKALLARKHGVKLILDAYDPQPLEFLEIFKYEKPLVRNTKYEWNLQSMLFSFHMADAVICANSKQKDLWLGLLLGGKQLTPKIYAQDCSLKQLIDTVPFGLSSKPPMKNGNGFRKMFQLAETDKIVVWGGGIWNWFDPLTLIQAIAQIAKERSDIKLIFMGTKHPNRNVPEMKMTLDAIALAKELKIIDQSVFFNYSWVPYEERGSYLLEADMGVSTHFDHLETQFSFRTRILDYLWAELPIITTQGDGFAELVEKHHLGYVVPYLDVPSLVKAITSIADHPEMVKTMKTNIATLKKNFYWTTLVKPLDRMLQNIDKQEHRETFPTWHVLKSCFHLFEFKTLCKAIYLKLKRKLQR